MEALSEEALLMSCSIRYYCKRQLWDRVCVCVCVSVCETYTILVLSWTIESFWRSGFASDGLISASPLCGNNVKKYFTLTDTVLEDFFKHSHTHSHPCALILSHYGVYINISSKLKFEKGSDLLQSFSLDGAQLQRWEEKKTERHRLYFCHCFRSNIKLCCNSAFKAPRHREACLAWAGL